MGLDMKTKKKICAEICTRYQKASKKEKALILDEHAETLGYNRDYLAHLLTNMGKARYVGVDRKPVKLVAKQPTKRQRKAKKDKQSGRPERYTPELVKVLTAIWKLFDFKCGKLLAPLMRSIMECLVTEFQIEDTIRELLMTISPATIDRKLKKTRQRFRIKGKCTTKPGSLLKNQIPIRVYFFGDEQKPGFFEADTVSHCGTTTAGEYCQTLTLTDVGSTWTELRALLNNAHRWAKEGIQDIHATLPFPMLGIDSDNGSEFINHQLLDWCVTENVKFTRARPYRKNDSCFVEQKNGDIVRRHAGYARFEGEAARDALATLYAFLNPLTNYFYPSIKLLAKEKLPSGRHKRIYEKEAKSPYQRLMDSPDVNEECKEELRQRKALLNPIELKYALNNARNNLLKLSQKESNIDLYTGSPEPLG